MIQDPIKMADKLHRLENENSILRAKLSDKVELENLYETQQMILEDLSFKFFKLEEKIVKAKETFERIIKYKRGGQETFRNMARNLIRISEGVLKDL